MINKESFKLSIIIPCYNEKTTINIILKKVIDSLEIEKKAVQEKQKSTANNKIKQKLSEINAEAGAWCWCWC